MKIKNYEIYRKNVLIKLQKKFLIDFLKFNHNKVSCPLNKILLTSSPLPRHISMRVDLRLIAPIVAGVLGC